VFQQDLDIYKCDIIDMSVSTRLGIYKCDIVDNFHV